MQLGRELRDGIDQVDKGQTISLADELAEDIKKRG